MGLMSTSDAFCAKSDKSIVNVPKSCKIVDNILLWASTKEELCKNARAILLNCRKLGITLTKKKVKFGQEIEFTGYHISACLLYTSDAADE